MTHFIVIRRPDDPNDTNVTSYKRLFHSEQEAKDFAKRVGELEQEDHDGTLIIFKNEVVLDHAETGTPSVRWLVQELLDSGDRVCPHCGGPVTDSEIGDYRWQCPECDEDFYDFECQPKD